jgi:hypothetical protein
VHGSFQWPITLSTTLTHVTCLAWTIYLYNNRDISYTYNYVYPNPLCQLALWEETGAPGENPRLSAER